MFSYPKIEEVKCTLSECEREIIQDHVDDQINFFREEEIYTETQPPVESNVQENKEEFNIFTEPELTEPDQIERQFEQNSHPIRSHKENVTNGFAKPTETTTTETKQIEYTTELADSYKELGNKCVKNQDFETALKHYTKAIDIKEDPIFYSNRAFCSLKLEQYQDCINDCSKAIQMNPKFVKAFYRRMQANEVLCEFDKALKDCKEVLKLEPKNLEAVASKLRLTNRIEGKDLSCVSSPKVSIPSWSKLDASVKDVNFIKKPPHLRSKKPLRRIGINQPLPSSNGTPPDKKLKDEENEAFKSAEINVDPNSPLTNGLAVNVVERIPLKPPNSSAQFYRTWRELTDDSQKYSYLQIIEPSTLNKLLGPLFNSEMCSNLLKILSEYFIRDNVPVTGILKQVIINDEFKILKMLLDAADKNAFEKLLKYVESNEPNSEDFTFIKDKYFNSM